MIQKHENTIKNNEESPVLIYPNAVKNRIGYDNDNREYFIPLKIQIVLIIKQNCWYLR